MSSRVWAQNRAGSKRSPPESPIRRLSIACLVLAAVVAAMPRAEAQAAGSGTVDVIEVSGLLDPVLADFVGHAVRDVERRSGAQRGGQPRREPDVQVRFSKLGLLNRLLPTVASPAVAYLLLVAGLLLVVFEFFTAGIGVAAAVGAGCLVLAAYGLDVLPTRPL